jgi:DNA-binding MarR family transcriptional regulator
MRSAPQGAFADFGPVHQDQQRNLNQQLASDARPKRGGGDEARWLRNVLRARASRADFFSEHLFADPAWDMLLSLYSAELEQKRVSVSSLSLASRVPATTALRWISALQKDGLIVRQPDPFDGRRIFVALSAEGSRAVRTYFNSLPATLYPFSA